MNYSVYNIFIEKPIIEPILRKYGLFAYTFTYYNKGEVDKIKLDIYYLPGDERTEECQISSFVADLEVTTGLKLLRLGCRSIEINLKVIIEL